MSPLVSKIYGFLIVTILIISSSLLYTKNSLNETKKNIQITTKGQANTQNSEQATSSIESPKNIEPVFSEVTQGLPENIATTNTINTIVKSPETSSTTKLVSSGQQQGITPASETDYQPGVFRNNPCDTPINYTLGSFDSRFAISKTHFLQITEESSSLWENALGKKLFQYNKEANQEDLTVNLIYDERQALTDQNKLLGTEIENTKDTAKKLELEYESMKIIFLRIKDEYTSGVDNFTLRQKKYNDTVAYWNEKGGAPQADYDALTLEKGQLQKVADTLTQKHNTLIAMLADINAKITRHNELIIFANENINENNSSANKKFTEGNYNSGTNKIIIYQFTDDIKLKRVLAHEFGHALGIDHAKNNQSIMYAINSATTTDLSFEDIQALKAVCAKK